PASLQTLSQRVRCMASWHPDAIVLRRFDHALAEQSPEAFIQTLVMLYHPSDIVVGYNYSFGHQGKGNPAMLWNLGKQMDFETHVLPPVHCAGGPVSSTRIRTALGEGDVVLAEQLLGRAYEITGCVRTGKQVGRKLGFPTANLRMEPGRIDIAHGVYLARVALDDVQYPAVVNIGAHPTLPEGPQTLEAFLLNFQGDLYGRMVRVSLLRKLRAEKRFPSAQALQEQIAQDVAHANAYFDLSPQEKSGR
ncbi:MAG: riboflavin biosynthesis protein RibF, partial [Clostridia bacterium]